MRSVQAFRILIFARLCISTANYTTCTLLLPRILVYATMRCMHGSGSRKEKRAERMHGDVLSKCLDRCCHVPSLSPGPLLCLRGVYVTVTCGRYTRRYCRRIPGVGRWIPGVETEREEIPRAASSQSWNQAGEVAKSSLLRTKLSRRSSPLPPNLFCLPVTLVPGSPVVSVPFC